MHANHLGGPHPEGRIAEAWGGDLQAEGDCFKESLLLLATLSRIWIYKGGPDGTLVSKEELERGYSFCDDDFIDCAEYAGANASALHRCMYMSETITGIPAFMPITEFDDYSHVNDPAESQLIGPASKGEHATEIIPGKVLPAFSVDGVNTVTPNIQAAENVFCEEETIPQRFDIFVGEYVARDPDVPAYMGPEGLTNHDSHPDIEEYDWHQPPLGSEYETTRRIFHM